MATKTRARPRRARETPVHRKARVKKLLARLEQAYPEAVCALSHHSALELLVATILSAQSTDARVNMVTPALFAKYRDAMAYAAADPAVLEQEIHSTGFFRNKTRSIIGMAQALVPVGPGLTVWRCQACRETRRSVTRRYRPAGCLSARRRRRTCPRRNSS